MLYRILKFVIGIGIRLYYKEVKISGKQNLPKDGPTIFIANHPNTLMDAWVIGMVSKQPVHFMAKATLFNSKFKLKLLKSLNAVPINRAGEGKTKGTDNTSSFEECYKILEEGKTLVIFPEGTSFQERVLRQLKSGTARIALEAENRNDGKLGLQVVAIGLNYSQPEKFRSRILVDIDPPASVTDYLDEFKEDNLSAAKKLTEKFRLRLERVLVTTANKEEDELIEDLHTILNSKYVKSDAKGVSHEVKHIKDIRDKIDEIKLIQPWLLNEIRAQMSSIQWRLDKLNIRADFLDRRFRSGMFFRQVIFSFIFIVIALPVFIYGAIHNAFQFLFTDWLVPKLSKDVEYYAPLAICVGLLVYPLVYAAFLLFGYHYFSLNWIGMTIYLLSMPISGLFAYWFKRYLQHISYKWRYMLLMIDNKEGLQTLQEEKLKLRKIIFD